MNNIVWRDTKLSCMNSLTDDSLVS